MGRFWGARCTLRVEQEGLRCKPAAALAPAPRKHLSTRSSCALGCALVWLLALSSTMAACSCSCMRACRARPRGEPPTLPASPLAAELAPGLGGVTPALPNVPPPPSPATPAVMRSEAALSVRGTTRRTPPLPPLPCLSTSEGSLGTGGRPLAGDAAQAEALPRAACCGKSGWREVGGSHAQAGYMPGQMSRRRLRRRRRRARRRRSPAFCRLARPWMPPGPTAIRLRQQRPAQLAHAGCAPVQLLVGLPPGRAHPSCSSRSASLSDQWCAARM